MLSHGPQLHNSQYFGGIVGRVANRIQNATFELDGKTYHLDPNDRGNTLHGGFNPLFENSTWAVDEASGNHVVLKFFSKDGDQVEALYL
jgi:aldose 1-epimerase